MDVKDAEKLYKEFQEHFPLKKLKKLTLEEYTNLDRNNSFCYWLETKTESLGSIWGGSSYKFGIYRSAGEIKPSGKAKNDGVYAWYAKYGNTKEIAFRNILSKIVEVAEASQNHEFSKIDSVDLGPSYKWKIAYLYSNMSLLNMYAEKGIRYIAQKHGFEKYKKAPISEIQAYLISQAQGKPLFEYSKELWNEWINSNEYRKQNDKEIENDEEMPQEIDENNPQFKSSLPKGFSLDFFSNKDYFARYVRSLLAKPFVILTGNSGTGKTRIARQIAHYLNVPSYFSTSQKASFAVGDVINEWTIRSISEDTIYLSNEKEPTRLRPIQKDLIKEFVDYYTDNPNKINSSNSEVANIVKERAGAKFDRFVYGYEATICALAKKVLSNKTDESYLDFKNTLVIPVGADWTDNTKVLGFYNPIKKEYQSTPILEFILLASQNKDIPFFLILDEMNLSHVERYFSDFLSAMESGEPIPLYKKNDDIESSVPEEIILPENLFVTGTVNIDETTYMFSPKVLDRANVIEFKPEMDNVLQNLLGEPSNNEIGVAEDGVAEGFMQLANKVRSENVPSEIAPILEKIKSILEKFYTTLESCGLEFAYRTVKEIRLYAIAAYETAKSDKPDATDIADIQILQKILPKIHGNKKQIGELLDKLDQLCETESLPLSRKKIIQMKDKLNRFQYASFI